MSDAGNETTTDSDRLPASPPRVDAERALVARFADRGEGDRECTLYPQDASGVDLMSRWITAGEGDVVPLDEMR
jgi:hypothetical protein